MLFEKVSLRILNIISRLTSRINVGVRTLIVFVCCMIMGIIFSFDPQSIYDTRRMMVLSIATFVITIMYADRTIKPVSWNKPVALAIELFAVSMIIIRMIHPVGQGYMIFAFDILILFPALFMVLNNTSKYAHFIDLLTFAILLTGIACFAAGFFLVYGRTDLVISGRVVGAAENPNYYGMIGLAMVMSGIYVAVRRHTNLLMIILAAVCIGIGISMTLASISRTSMLASVGCAVVLAVYKVRWVKDRKAAGRPTQFFIKSLNGVLLFVLIVALSATGSLKLHQKAYFDNQAGVIVSETMEAIIPTVYAEDGAEEQDEEELDAIKGRFSADLGLNSFSSGRLLIWQMYLERLNLLGNDYDDIRENGDFAALRESRAHNNMLDYAFRFGIPSGLIYCVFYVTILINATSMTFKRRNFDACSLWVVMTVASYAIYAMVEISTLPYTRYMPCLFFLSASPLMCRRGKSRDL